MSKPKGLRDLVLADCGLPGCTLETDHTLFDHIPADSGHCHHAECFDREGHWEACLWPECEEWLGPDEE